MITSFSNSRRSADESPEAHADRMTSNFSERASDGSFCGRRGLFEHHARVLRQARAELGGTAQ